MFSPSVFGLTARAAIPDASPCPLGLDPGDEWEDRLVGEDEFTCSQIVSKEDYFAPGFAQTAKAAPPPAGLSPAPQFAISSRGATGGAIRVFFRGVPPRSTGVRGISEDQCFRGCLRAGCTCTPDRSDVGVFRIFRQRDGCGNWVSVSVHAAASGAVELREICKSGDSVLAYGPRGARILRQGLGPAYGGVLERY